MRARRAELRRGGGRVALVPTMGALHAGHLSLVHLARAVADAVVVSVFVNPLQFGPAEDFARYPRDLESDAALLADAGTDVLFAPTAQEMYPPGRAMTTVQPGGAAEGGEGAVRPGHFVGVLTVVAKLFNIVQPDAAVFGQKDLQQAEVVRAMIRDLDVPVALVMGPTVREPDGLALSSRNRYLSGEERRSAPRLYAALAAAADVLRQGGAARTAEAAGSAVLAEDPMLRPDYLSVVDAESFRPPRPESAAVAVVGAVRIGGTRLLDNVIVDTASVGTARLVDETVEGARRFR